MVVELGEKKLIGLALIAIYNDI